MGGLSKSSNVAVEGSKTGGGLGRALLDEADVDEVDGADADGADADDGPSPSLSYSSARRFPDEAACMSTSIPTPALRTSSREWLV